MINNRIRIPLILFISLLIVFAIVISNGVGHSQGRTKKASKSGAPYLAVPDPLVHECDEDGDCEDDGNPCTTEYCDDYFCRSSNNTDPCDDDVFCNGTDTCSGGSCSVHSGDPCASGPECNNTCQETTDTCYTPAGTSCNDDGKVCTNDECNGAGSCVHPNNTSTCDDRVFCNGTDTCSGGSCSAHSGDPCPSGSTCDETYDTCTPKTYDVKISPSSSMVRSGDTVTFTAVTSEGGIVIGSAYLFEFEKEGEIGSSIVKADGNKGLYTAGDNYTGSVVIETIKVTDTNHDITDTAEVTVQVKEPPPPPFTISITPEETMLISLKSLQFTAETISSETLTPLPEEECNFQWEMDSPSIIGSTVTEDGFFNAGINNTNSLVTERLRVSDTAHSDALPAIATITVYARMISIPDFPLPPGLLPTSYQMISIPLWPNNGDATHILRATGSTGYNPYLIRVFKWDGQFNRGQGEYREYPDIPLFEPGEGFWVITLLGGYMEVDGIPADTSQDFTITLQPGWTQIGNPFPFVVDWNQVSPLEGEVEPPWTFVGSYLPAPTLTPWHGYFVYNNSPSPVTISIPPREGTENIRTAYTPLSETEKEGFELQIKVHHIPRSWLNDTYNFVGVAEDSQAERDSKDLHEPPPVFHQQVSLYFPHKWEGKSERYTTDFRSLDSQQEFFEFTVSPGKRLFGLMKLSWSDMEDVPYEYRLEFTDPETGTTLDMREVDKYWFFSSLGIDKHFKITMTKTSD